MSAVAGLAATISTEVEGWPFATFGAFQRQARHAQFISKAIYITVNPIVQAADLAAWELYVQSPANSWM